MTLQVFYESLWFATAWETHGLVSTEIALLGISVGILTCLWLLAQSSMEMSTSGLSEMWVKKNRKSRLGFKKKLLRVDDRWTKRRMNWMSTLLLGVLAVNSIAFRDPLSVDWCSSKMTQTSKNNLRLRIGEDQKIKTLTMICMMIRRRTSLNLKIVNL